MLHLRVLRLKAAQRWPLSENFSADVIGPEIYRFESKKIKKLDNYSGRTSWTLSLLKISQSTGHVLKARTSVVLLLISFHMNSPSYTPCPKDLQKKWRSPLYPITRKPAITTGIGSRAIEKMWGEGGDVESHLHYTLCGMRQTISCHCRMRHLKQRKRRENACIKALVFTAQASCGF